MINRALNWFYDPVNFRCAVCGEAYLALMSLALGFLSFTTEPQYLGSYLAAAGMQYFWPTLLLLTGASVLTLKWHSHRRGLTRELILARAVLSLVAFGGWTVSATAFASGSRVLGATVHASWAFVELLVFLQLAGGWWWTRAQR